MLVDNGKNGHGRHNGNVTGLRWPSLRLLMSCDSHKRKFDPLSRGRNASLLGWIPNIQFTPPERFKRRVSSSAARGEGYTCERTRCGVDWWNVRRIGRIAGACL